MEKEKRFSGSLSTFLITTFVLPTLLVAPSERDIRIINVINPFHAAAEEKEEEKILSDSSRASARDDSEDKSS